MHLLYFSANDVFAISADQLGLPCIIVPTICATDAPTSGCSVTYTAEGEYIRVEYQKTNPRLVLVDSEIIASAILAVNRKGESKV